jgi:hypothetical protein
MQEYSLLILGAGWTSTFLEPLLRQRNISYRATTRSGRDGTIAFEYDDNVPSEFAAAAAAPSEYDAAAAAAAAPSEYDAAASFEALPPARTVLITFPLRGAGRSRHLTELYRRTHPQTAACFIQLGSSGIFTPGSAQDSGILTPGSAQDTGILQEPWITRHSPYDTANGRAVAEDELLGLGGAVLDLAGLWGGARSPRDWLARVADSRDKLAAKGSLHLVHGEDVARAVVALSQDFTPGQRWLVTDMLVYDWWTLAAAFGGPEEKAWVAELMRERDVRALPRSMHALGRCYDSRDFWARFRLAPTRQGLAGMSGKRDEREGLAGLSGKRDEREGLAGLSGKRDEREGLAGLSGKRDEREDWRG